MVRDNFKMNEHHWFFKRSARFGNFRERCASSVQLLWQSQKYFSVQMLQESLYNYRPHPKYGGRYCFQFVSSHLGGVPGPGPGRGGPRSRSRWGSQIQVQVGGVPGPGPGGIPGLRSRGGVPSLSKGKNFWHQIWLDTCSDQKKNFLLRDPPPQ